MSTVLILLDPWPLVTKPVNFNAALNRKSHNFHKQWQHCCKTNNYLKPDPRKKIRDITFFVFHLQHVQLATTNILNI